MKIQRLLLLFFLLYYSTGCEKMTIQPNGRAILEQKNITEQGIDSNMTSSSTITVYKYFSYNGIKITLPTAYTYGSIYNSKGLVARLPPVPPGPCSPNDKNCPTYKPIITATISAVYKTLTISLPNNPYSIKVRYNLTGTTYLLNSYYPSITFTAYQYQ